MTRKEILQKSIDDLCDRQIKNLERLTTNPEVPMRLIFEEDSRINKEIIELRKQLVIVSLFPHGRDSSKY